MTQLTVQPSHSFAKIGLPAPSFSLAFDEEYGNLRRENNA